MAKKWREIRDFVIFGLICSELRLQMWNQVELTFSKAIKMFDTGNQRSIYLVKALRLKSLILQYILSIITLKLLLLRSAENI